MYNDIEKRTSDMNEIFRALKQTEYNNGRYDEIMSSVRDCDYSDVRAAEKLNMSPEEFSVAYQEWIASQAKTALA